MALVEKSIVSEDGWFSETEVMWPGQKFCLKVGAKGILYDARSDFQHIVVLESETYGRVLVLDGVIQLTERDEFAYQEMIVHLPLFAHAQPKNVLIVGGGDGGVLREVTKHACVERVDMCEIDPAVCQVSQTYFPTTMATAFKDDRLTLIHADAAEFLREVVTPTGAATAAAAAAKRVREADDWRGYDVIIVDSSDPVGPAETLFQPQFYESMRAALAPGGVVCTQGECLWLHLPLIATVISACGDLFPSVEYAFTTVPTYPSGQIGFVLCSLDESPNALTVPKRGPTPKFQAALRYYTPAVHGAAFALPHFAAIEIQKAKRRA